MQTSLRSQSWVSSSQWKRPCARCCAAVNHGISLTLGSEQQLLCTDCAGQLAAELAQKTQQAAAADPCNVRVWDLVEQDDTSCQAVLQQLQCQIKGLQRELQLLKLGLREVQRPRPAKPGRHRRC